MLIVKQKSNLKVTLSQFYQAFLDNARLFYFC